MISAAEARISTDEINGYDKNLNEIEEKIQEAVHRGEYFAKIGLPCNRIIALLEQKGYKFGLDIVRDAYVLSWEE